MSVCGWAAMSVSLPGTVPRSQTTPRASLRPHPSLTFPTAASTRPWSRPTSVTRAPALASPVAMARPMPPVEPVTMAVLSDRSIILMFSSTSIFANAVSSQSRHQPNRKAEMVVSMTRSE